MVSPPAMFFICRQRRHHNFQLYTFHCQLKKELLLQFLLGGLYEFLPAFGTGNGNLAFSLRHSHLLVTPGTVVIAVILVFQLLEKEKEFAVFFVAFVDVAGKGTKNSDTHENIWNCGEGQLDYRTGKKGCQQRTGKTCAEDRHIQLIGAVAAFHKPLQTGPQPVACISQPVSKSVHT